VKDDAVGYAHSSDVSLPALIPRRRRGRSSARRLQREFCGRPRALPMCGSMATKIRSNAPGFESKVKLLAEIDAYVRDKTRGCGRSR